MNQVQDITISQFHFTQSNLNLFVDLADTIYTGDHNTIL